MATAGTTRVLRTIAPSFVVPLPTGVSIRTRLHPTPAEDAVLRQVGDYLGGLYRTDLKARTRIGVVPQALNGRTDRKRNLTAHSSSRWAGAITRAAEDQFQLGMRALAAECVMLADTIRALETRLAVPVGGRDGRIAGYRSAREHQAKRLRLSVLNTRLAAAQASKTLGSPTIVVGGRKLWSARQNLAAAQLDAARWRTRWDAARMFLTADGETGAVRGNQTIRVESDGTLNLKVPTALTAKLGPRLRLTTPVTFAHRGGEWADRADMNAAIRYDISYDADVDRWYLNASWGYPPVLTPPVEAFHSGRIIGVDLNADHLTAGVIDASGNPVGTPAIIPLVVAGLPATTRDGHLRQAISTLLDVAVNAGAKAIAVENLNFSDSRNTGRETMGRGARGKRFRRTVAGIPTAQFRQRLTMMAANRGIWVIAVDPAYTSQWGAQHWAAPLKERASDHTATRHQAAAVAIGRRAHGHRITRRADGNRTQQRMRPASPQQSLSMKPVSSTPVTGPPRRQPPRLTG